MALFLRNLFWTFLCPGTIAGLIPWFVFGVSEVAVDWRNPVQLGGAVVASSGIALLLTCVWEFATRGRGTLSPLDPPRHLVIRGPYRVMRNPMYVGVSLIILGQALIARSWPLLGYWVLFFTLANVFVRLYEEPALERMFGEEYVAYKRRIGRWGL